MSENSFRGIFHSVVQWGLARGGAESAGGRARLRALFRVADTLAGTLRSVMTPYFASLLGPAAAALAATSEESQTPKKRKKEAIKRWVRRLSNVGRNCQDVMILLSTIVGCCR